MYTSQDNHSAVGQKKFRFLLKFFCLGFIIHLVAAIIMKDVVGLNIKANPGWRSWDWFWQTIPSDLLRTNLTESLFYLHAQPPLFNIYGAFFIKFFPHDFLSYMHYGNIILGSLLSGITFIIVYQFTRHTVVAILTTIWIALYPALFLYEAYILYEILTAFLVTSSVFFLALFLIERRFFFLYFFILVLNLLVLTRSFYHLILLIPGFIVVIILAGKQWRKVALVSLIICLLSIGWYGKNKMLFDFFGSSSWDGMGLWKIASLDYSQAHLAELATNGVLDAIVVEEEVFSPPSTFATYGYDANSNIEVLARDDFNNINIPAISALYKQNSIRLILYDPAHYVRSVYKAYLQYSLPSSQFKHNTLNLKKIAILEKVHSQIFQGQAIAQRSPFYFGSFSFFVIPMVLLLYFCLVINMNRFSTTRWIHYAHEDAALLFTAFLILYTTIVGTSFEFGENDRFKFDIELLLWCFSVGVFYRCSLPIIHWVSQFSGRLHAH